MPPSRPWAFCGRARRSRSSADPELLPFRAASFDLAVSALALHWVADLPGALIQLRRIVKPDGLFLGALFGGATLGELRTALLEAELAEEGGASPRVSPTASLADAAALLQRAGFAMPVADADTIAVTYPDALALMRDLRAMGETNALSARRHSPLRRGTLARAVAIYGERFGLPDGRIPASFRDLVSDRLGARCEPAQAAAAGQRHPSPRRRARHGRDFRRRPRGAAGQGRAMTRPPVSPPGPRT